MRARRFWSGLLLGVLALLATLVWMNREDLWAFRDILGAYTAKEYCSCRYVVGNPASYCADYVRQWLPLGDFFDDSARKRVTASGMGRTHTAGWQNERHGCQLLPQADPLPQR